MKDRLTGQLTAVALVVAAAGLLALLAVRDAWPLAAPVVSVSRLLLWLLRGALACVPVFALGTLLLRLVWPQSITLPSATRVPLAWALGGAMIVASGLVLLACGMYTSLLWHAVAASGWILVAARLLDRRGRGLSAAAQGLNDLLVSLREIKLLSWSGLLVLLLAIAAAHAALPPTSRDELTYHLVLPRLWDVQGDWWVPTENAVLLFPANAELIWAYAAALGGLLNPRLVTLLCALLATMVLSDEMRRQGAPRRCRDLSLAFLLVTPVALTSAAVCYVEWPMLLYLLLGWVTARRFVVTGEKGAAVVAAITWGVALGMKYTALVFVALLAAEWLVHLVRQRRAAALHAAAVLVLGAAVLAAPWWARNAYATGDPVYPLGGLLVPHASDASAARGIADYARLEGRWRFLPWLYHATADPVADHRLHPLWPLLLVAVLVFGWRRWRALPWLSVLVATAVLAPFSPAPRIYLPLMLLLCLFLPSMIAPFERWSFGPWLVHASLVLATVASVPFAFHYFFMSGSRADQDYLLGAIDRSELLRREGLVTPAMEWVREQTSHDTRVWTWCEDRALYLDRWVWTDFPLGPPAVLDIAAAGPQSLTAAARGHGIDYVLLRHDRCPETWAAFPDDLGTGAIHPDTRETLIAWVGTHLREVARDERYVLYRVVP